MDGVKEAFNKVKQDMDFLRSELNNLKVEFVESRQIMTEICEIVKDLYNQREQTTRHINPTNQTHIQTDSTPFNPLKHQNMPFSTGNGGVPTDKQTNRQTDRQTHFTQEFEEKTEVYKDSNPLDNAMEILDSLDEIKKEIRLKFKRLTEQELLVFSTIYQLTEHNEPTDYRTVANKLNLTESSIRDYTGKLIRKGIPVEKIKLNNKSIKLRISQNLKKIATLSTILKLREI